MHLLVERNVFFSKRVNNFKICQHISSSLATYVCYCWKQEGSGNSLILQFMAEIECCEKSFCSFSRKFRDNLVENV